METPDKFNAQSYAQFLEMVLSAYQCPIILIEDGAKYHNGPVAKEFKEKKKSEGKLFIYRLPSYSPDYNPIEKLWKKPRGMLPIANIFLHLISFVKLSSMLLRNICRRLPKLFPSWKRWENKQVFCLFKIGNYFSENLYSSLYQYVTLFYDF